MTGALLVISGRTDEYSEGNVVMESFLCFDSWRASTEQGGPHGRGKGFADIEYKQWATRVAAHQQNRISTTIRITLLLGCCWTSRLYWQRKTFSITRRPTLYNHWHNGMRASVSHARECIALFPTGHAQMPYPSPFLGKAKGKLHSETQEAHAGKSPTHT